MTDVSPAMAPTFTRYRRMRTPVASIPTAIGSGTLSRVNDTMAVSSPATRMNTSVQIASEPRIPVGMSRCGFLASCAAVETASKPM
jgi:hypothetical protein